MCNIVPFQRKLSDNSDEFTRSLKYMHANHQRATCIEGFEALNCLSCPKQKVQL